MKKWDEGRELRAKVYYICLISFLLIVIGFFTIKIKHVILPIFVGALLAYLCKPLSNVFKYRFIPTSLRYAILGLGISTILAFVFVQIKDSLPKQEEQISLSIRLQYKINQKVERYLHLDRQAANQRPNFLVKIISNEVDPILDKINQFLSLDQQEQSIFEAWHQQQPQTLLNKRIYSYYLHNKAKYYSKYRDIASESSVDLLLGPGKIELASLYSSLSSWLLTPLIFIFLLFDKGRVRKYFISLVPNRYFELSLTLVNKVDSAIGNYLRGTFLQSSLVGISLLVPLILIGIPWKAALLISLISTMANVIPFLGPVIALAIGLIYSLIIEEVDPLIPFMTSDHIVVGVVASVGFAKLLDDLYYQPVVLGNAVDLHPIVVILVLVLGASLYGVIGMLLSVPCMVVSKVILETLTDQLKAYKII